MTSVLTKETEIEGPLLTIDPVGLIDTDKPVASGVLRAYVVHKDPDIYVIPNILSDFEIEHLLELANDLWVPSIVGAGVYKTRDEGKDLENRASPNRTSYSCTLSSSQTATLQNIENRLAYVAGLNVTYLERLNLVRYSPGQFFNQHHDGRFRPKTIFIYLNDLPENDGGETLFPKLGVKFVPRKGCAVMWSNTEMDGVEDMRTIHQGLPPKSAMKYGVNVFFNDKPMREITADGAYVDIVARDDGDDEDGQGDSPGYRTIDGLYLEDNLDTPAKPGQLKAFAVTDDPKIRVVPELLSRKEADILIGVSEGRCAQEDMLALGAVESRIASIAGLPIAHMEQLQVAKCKPGTYPAKVSCADGAYSAKFGVTTVFVFLNSLPTGAGGELQFPELEVQVQPRRGCAVVWSAMPGGSSCEDIRVVHQGRPPKDHVRYSVIGVFRALPVR